MGRGIDTARTRTDGAPDPAVSVTASELPQDIRPSALGDLEADRYVKASGAQSDFMVLRWPTRLPMTASFAEALKVMARQGIVRLAAGGLGVGVSEWEGSIPLTAGEIGQVLAGREWVRMSDRNVDVYLDELRVGAFAHDPGELWLWPLYEATASGPVLRDVFTRFCRDAWAAGE